mgnify:CR=1 FL=1
MSKNTNQTVIPIYNLNGDIVNELVIKEKITHVGSRVSRGKDAYYKGTGVPYMQHYTKSLDGINLKNDYEVCILYTYPSQRDRKKDRMPSSA